MPGELTAALASLTQTFDEALAELLGSIQITLALPELSPPSGNGVAYDKFLAIYNGLIETANQLDIES